MNELKIFENEQFGTIRTVEIDNTPYFVGKDVAEILGYSNTRDALSKHVDNEDKNTVAIHDGIQGNPNQVVINESGLYSLILSSKLPKAKEFKHWVTSEVLPAIRKHGVYAVDEVLENPDMLISALQALKEEKAKAKRLTETLAVQEKQIAELQPKASYYDVVLNCKDLVSVTEIAKDYGKSAKWKDRCDMQMRAFVNSTMNIYGCTEEQVYKVIFKKLDSIEMFELADKLLGKNEDG